MASLVISLLEPLSTSDLFQIKSHSTSWDFWDTEIWLVDHYLCSFLCLSSLNPTCLVLGLGSLDPEWGNYKKRAAFSFEFELFVLRDSLYNSGSSTP